MSLNLDANVIFDYYVSGKKIVEIQDKREVRNASRVLSSYDLSPGKGGRGKENLSRYFQALTNMHWFERYKIG